MRFDPHFAFIESVNETLHAKCLNIDWFGSISESNS